MTTQQEYAQQAQYMKNMGFPDAEIQRRLQLQMSAEQAEAQRREAQQREAEHPKPAFSFDRYDDIDRRSTLALARASDPLRIAQEQAEEQRLVAAITALDQQLLPLQQQRRALADQLARLRFQG